MNVKTVMIVDDSVATRSMLTAIIESIGECRIVEAANGFEALRLLPREHVNLILTDINMPGINGLEFISYLRSNPNYVHIPLFIVSTESSAKDLERGKKFGVNEYIVKPFSPEALQKLVKQYLNATS